ncbi:MAG: 1-acyl-sn-glycerol-3-phosphate acyltransferase [Sphingomonadales bacterium]|nr:1-acyl-sn-glycerol-3-phosphate acyltransferase [Sphingomonadales bacterium]MBD3773025.1 1-acyl-sn-glycerol-3-phosphate acyltransferase [Paracoccaceae bacterium]
MIYLRNLAFYLFFWALNPVYILLVSPAVLMGRGALRAVIHGWVRWHRWSVVNLLGIDVVVEGGPVAGPALYAIKHESMFEAIDAPRLFKLPAPFAKAELFRIPVWGYAGKKYGVVRVDRDGGATELRKMIAAARKLSDAGRPLLIFPEGTRVPHGQRHALQSGFAGLYKMLRLPVVPVAVNSGPTYRQPIKPRGTIIYRFGEPIEPGLPREEIEARVLDAINALND